MAATDGMPWNFSSRSCSGVLLAVCLFLVDLVVVVKGEVVLGEKNDDFDFDGLPGVQHEFKVDIPGGVEDCFFQRMAPGAKLHVSFEVLRGGDRNVDMILRDSAWQIINAHYWKNQGVLEHDVVKDDTYAICFDNSYSRFSGKLVYVYLVSFVMADWSAYVQEFQEIDSIAQNATQSLSEVELSVQEMKKVQTQARFNIVRDWYLVWGLNRYVQNWSIAQCSVIVLTSVIQVVFMRRLFRSTNVTPTFKPRA